MTDKRLPELGANPLQVAFQDYQRMEQQLGLAREELASKTDMVNDLLRENEFLRRNYDKTVLERDRFQALAVNLATRAVSVREAVDRLVAEAVSARAAPAPDVADASRIAADSSLSDDLKRLWLEQEQRRVDFVPDDSRVTSTWKPPVSAGARVPAAQWP